MLFGIPNIRMEFDHLPFSWATPRHVHKDYIKNPEKYKPKDFLVNYFFAKPDYEAPHEKLFYTSLLGAKFGTFYGGLYICSKDINVWSTAITTFAKHFGIITASFATYGAVSNITANIRGQKDDIFNHAIGGSFVGFIYGYLFRSSAIGAQVGAGCALIGVFLKLFSKSNYFIYHPLMNKMNDRVSIDGVIDFRLFREREEKVRRGHYLFGDT